MCNPIRQTPNYSTIYIKYMVSKRCQMVVKDVLDTLGIDYVDMKIGSVDLMEELSPELHEKLNESLMDFGLELLDNNKSILIEKIKNVIIESVHYTDKLPLINYSDFLSEKLQYDYTYLSNLFSEVKGITIAYYIISHKIERVKELILYDELNLTEIARIMNYSSVAHLSNQFKKITGLTPSYFKQLKQHRSRIALEDVCK